MNSSTKKAFTLIELLVVISIIALLISILLPALRAAREAGKTAKNLSHLRQIQISLFTYADDAKGQLPYARYTSLPYWAGMLAGTGYISDPFIFWGPFRNTEWFGTLGKTTRENTATNPRASNVYELSGFGVNQYLMPNHYNNNGVEAFTYRIGDNVPVNSLNTPKSNNPSDVPAVSEFFHNNHAGTPYAYWGYYSGMGSTGLFAPAGSISRSYLDGHAVARDGQELGWTITSPTTGTWRYSTIATSRIFWFNPN